jgi:coproporphyrinogen III oxidase
MLNPDANVDAVANWLRVLQNELCADFLRLDGADAFKTDTWSRPEGGMDVTRVLAESGVFEKVGVNYTSVQSESLPESATAGHPNLAGAPFMACGVSVVAHPRNPYVPTAHMNIRFFKVQSRDQAPLWWFGGGFDLTPFYAFHEDVTHWHRVARDTCAPFGEGFYPRFKKWCDEFFFIPHRGEPRGVGGIFFDDFSELGFDRTLEFAQAVGKAFMKAYRPIVECRRHLAHGEAERRFQLYRRGRYIEFNLVYDRGTLFGLQSGGRVESVLMSLPPIARFDYDWRPEPGSPEDLLYTKYLKTRQWV